jgi:Terminase large subunit, T4likevirus-type, N-terminal
LQEPKIIKPQEGYQLQALSSSADIVIGGGAAGAGKTFCLLLDPLRYNTNPEFAAVIFRRTTPQITNPGALWDQSNKLYPLTGAKSNKTSLAWTFQSGARIKFSHLEYEKNVYDWQGSEIPFIGFDELTHFSKFVFFYLLSRNRSTSGVKPCVRATCNPDPDSWVADLISWWIGEDGFPLAERSGVLRYFVKDGDSFIWGDSENECIEKAGYFLDPLVEKSGQPPQDFVKSITFIGGTVYENKELLNVDPGYLGNLAAQDEDSKLQLLEGNWKVALNPLDVYNYTTFKDIFTNDFVEKGAGAITVDAAIFGADKLIICYFLGRRLEDLVLMEKSSGKDIIDKIRKFQAEYKVPNSRVVYDANGVGAFIGGKETGFIPGSIAFDNNGKAIPTKKDLRKFNSLKSQCYYLSGDAVNNAEYYISEKVAGSMYDNKMTIRQRFLFERKAIKKGKRNNEEPYNLIQKKEMKSKYLGGESPDLLDALMMNEYFYLVPKRTAPKSTIVRRNR